MYIYTGQIVSTHLQKTNSSTNKGTIFSKVLNFITVIMRFSDFFGPIGMIALRAIPLVMADSGSLPPAFDVNLATYDFVVNYTYYHDFGLVDVAVEIPGANLKDDHVEMPVHVKADASPIHINETYTVKIYFKNDWTDAHRWEAGIPFIATLYTDLQTRINRSNCKLGLRLHLTGKAALGRLEETVPLTEISEDKIKDLAKAFGLC
jgi:hypothetical protein